MTAITFVRANGGGREDVNTVPASGTALTIDLIDGNVHHVTLTGNVTLTLAGTVPGVACELTLIVQQDSTGSRTITWPATVEWPAATAPTVTATPGSVDLFRLVTVDDGATWYGTVAGQAFG